MTAWLSKVLLLITAILLPLSGDACPQWLEIPAGSGRWMPLGAGGGSSPRLQNQADVLHVEFNDKGFGETDICTTAGGIPCAFQRGQWYTADLAKLCAPPNVVAAEIAYFGVITGGANSGAPVLGFTIEGMGQRGGFDAGDLSNALYIDAGPGAPGVIGTTRTPSSGWMVAVNNQMFRMSVVAGDNELGEFPDRPFNVPGASYALHLFVSKLFTGAAQ